MAAEEKCRVSRAFDARFFTPFPRLVSDKHIDTSLNDLQRTHFHNLREVSRLDRLDFDCLPVSSPHPSWRIPRRETFTQCPIPKPQAFEKKSSP